MPDLPIELWHSIFDNLELTDLLSCALVSKTLHSAVKEYRIQEIAFTRQIWSHTRSIYRHRIDASMTWMLRGSSFNFDYLKCLMISSLLPMDLSEINKFTQLEQLDIGLKNYRNEMSKTLSLANLKVLQVFEMPGNLPYLELNTPRLESMSTFSLEKLDFIYPNSIRWIRTFHHCGKLSAFRNLEKLVFSDHYDELKSYTHWNPNCLNFHEFSLTTLTKLKEINFFFYGYRNLNQVSKIIANILALRPDLPMFWHDVRIIDADLVAEYAHTQRMNYKGSRFSMAFQLRHYEKLKNKVHDYHDYFDFNRLMKFLHKDGFDLKSEEFTSKFLAMFSFRRIDVVRQVVEQELLMELIARSPNLVSLCFVESSLSQLFFDQMAVRLNGIPLRELHFWNPSKELLNFEFMLGFHKLESFQTDQRLSNEFVSKLLRLPLLSEIKIASSLKIQRFPSNRFHLNGESLGYLELLSIFDPESKPYKYPTSCSLM